MSTDDVTAPLTTPEAAVRAALAIQNSEGSGYGVGVSFGDNSFVQWVRAPSRSASAQGIEFVEARVSESRADLVAQLTDEGYRPHPSAKLAQENIWLREGDDALTWPNEAELAAFLVLQLRMIGAEDGIAFNAYP